MIDTRQGLGVREISGDALDHWDHWVRRFPGHRVTHLRAWIASLESAGLGRPLYLVFERDGDVVGCLPGLLTRVGPLTIFGSPMAGWQTVSMGPVFDPARLTTAALMDVLVPYLESCHGVAHIEMMHGGLDPQAMAAAGFASRAVFTFRAPMTPGDAPRTLKAMKDSARRNIKRAERLGLIVSFEDDPTFVEEHYRQLCEVYRRNGTTIPFTERRIAACFQQLQPSGNLLAVRVALPGDRGTIATGMFLVEGRELSLWMWAHHTHYRWYRPTELMTWVVMQRAMAMGCDTFDFMGGGEFKTRLGALPDVSKQRWIRSRSPWLARARDLAETGFKWQQAVRGRVERLGERLVQSVRRPAARRLSACVLGDIDLVRALGLAGIASDVVAPPGDPARSSRHTRAALPWIDPSARPADLVESLLAHGAAQSEPPVLYYDSDAALLLVSRHRDRLREAFRFVVPDATLVEHLVDKGRFQQLAARLQLPVPPARILRPAHEPSYAAEAVDYPALLKPVVRRPETWRQVAGDAKALRVESAAEVVALWPRLAALGQAVLAQTIIPGPESALESYHTYVDDKGAVVAEFTGKKIRTWPASFGDSCALAISDAEDVRALGRDVVRRLGLRGVAKLDIKRAPDGTLHLLEVNARFTLWHHLAARAGLNIPALVHGDLTASPRPDAIPAARAGARWCKPWRDWRAARADGWPSWRWLRWAAGCDAVRGFAWRDPWPLLRALLERRIAALALHPMEPTHRVWHAATPRSTT